MHSYNAEDLENFAAALLTADGFKEDESRTTAKSLILSNLYGHDSHGIIRIPQYINMHHRGVLRPDADFKIIKQTNNSFTADAHQGLGQVQMTLAIERLLHMIKENGIVCGAIKNCGHIGRLGEWSESIAAKGFACMVTNNDNGSVKAVVPPGGKEPVTSTNPIAFGIPLPEQKVFSLDMSTSAVAIGKVNVARVAKEKMKGDVLQDKHGNLSSDPEVFFEKGAILPMGGAQGYKGFGLAMFVDFLAAGLSGGLAPASEPDGESFEAVSNVVITIWNAEQYSGREHMQDQAHRFIEFIRQSEPIDPDEPIRIAGDRAYECASSRKSKGIPLDDGTIEKLTDCANRLRISSPF